MYDNIDKRRNFHNDVVKLGTEQWYVWLDPDERLEYKKAVEEASTPYGLNSESITTIEKLIKSCQRKAQNANNQPSSHGSFKWGS